jgi:hypothetical protein
MHKKRLSAVTAIVVFITALILSEQTIHYVFSSFKGTVAANILNTIDESLNSGPVDVIFFGDSTGKDGILPDIIEQETGLKSINLASYAMVSGFADIYFLNKYLQKNTPPKKIFILRTLYTWKKPIRFDEYLEVSPDIGTSFYLLKNSVFSVEKFFHAAIARHARILRENNAIRRKVTAPWNYDRYIPEYANGRVIQGKHFVRDESLELLERMCNIAEKYDIEMYILQAPYAEKMKVDVDFMSSSAEIISTIQSVTENNSHCSFVDTLQFYKENLMADKTHTNKKGAEVFSTWLANTYLRE